MRIRKKDGTVVEIPDQEDGKTTVLDSDQLEQVPSPEKLLNSILITAAKMINKLQNKTTSPSYEPTPWDTKMLSDSQDIVKKHVQVAVILRQLAAQQPQRTQEELLEEARRLLALEEAPGDKDDA